MAAKGAPKSGKKPATKTAPKATAEPAPITTPEAPDRAPRAKSVPVHWREDEIDGIVAEVVRLAIEIGEPLPFGYGRFKALLDRAQKNVLPEGRRRSLAVMKAFTRIEQRVALKHSATIARKAREDVAEPAPATPAPVVPQSTPLAPAEDARDGLARAAADALVSIVAGSPFYRALLESLADRVKRDLAAQLAEFAAPGKPLPAPTTGAAANEPGKPKVVVVGLLDRQAARIRGEFGQLFDLRFIASDQAPRGSIYTQCKDALAVVVMTRFISHEHDRQAQANSDNVVRLNGGITDLERFLKESRIAA